MTVSELITGIFITESWFKEHAAGWEFRRRENSYGVFYVLYHVDQPNSALIIFPFDGLKKLQFLKMENIPANVIEHLKTLELGLDSL